jgi:hypothetical protein
MNRVFLDLSPEEATAIAIALAEGEQLRWTLEETEDRCRLCGYFIGDFQRDWEDLQRHPTVNGKDADL